MESGDIHTQEVFEQRRRGLADHILEHPEEFDMDTWGYQHSCGTVACLAGNAALQAAREGLCKITWLPGGLNVIKADGIANFVDRFARGYLGLVDNKLFYRFDLTAETAAKALLEAPYCCHPKEF